MNKANKESFEPTISTKLRGSCRMIATTLCSTNQPRCAVQVQQQRDTPKMEDINPPPTLKRKQSLEWVSSHASKRTRSYSSGAYSHSDQIKDERLVCTRKHPYGGRSITSLAYELSPLFSDSNYLDTVQIFNHPKQEFWTPPKYSTLASENLGAKWLTLSAVDDALQRCSELNYRNATSQTIEQPRVVIEAATSIDFGLSDFTETSRSPLRVLAEAGLGEQFEKGVGGITPPPTESPSCGTSEASQVLEPSTSPGISAPTLKASTDVGKGGEDHDTLARQTSRSNEDLAFVDQVKIFLERQSSWKTVNVGRRQARRILAIINVAQRPNDTEARFVSGDEAATLLQAGSFFPGPIIAEGQQPLPLQTISQFLNELYHDTAKVWIQDPSTRLSRNMQTAKQVTVAQVKRRFAQPSPAQYPWNCLEMAAHVEDGLRPAFLNNEDCRLLTKIKLPSSTDSTSRRGFEPGWKEVEKWTLLAQGGALTTPHQDSHGYSTYITMNQGTIGFGWLSNPTVDERAGWRAAPDTFVGGRWRYVVLRPGQTIFFPSGTVHLVFRLPSAGDTLAFGGHVLRCSQIVGWVQAMLEEQEESAVTNELMSVSGPAYLDRVERFVKQAVRNGTVEKWGGKEAVEEFLRLKAKFMKGLPG